MLGVPCLHAARGHRAPRDRSHARSARTRSWGWIPERIGVEVAEPCSPGGRLAGGCHPGRVGRARRRPDRRRARRRRAGARARIALTRRHMTLVVDLDLHAVPESVADQTSLDLHTLASRLRSPRRLLGLVRADHHDRVEIRLGALPTSALQAIVQLSLIAARADTWTVGGRRFGRAGFAAHAIASAVTAIARELCLSLVAATVRLERAGRRSFAIPIRPEQIRSALYLRAEPSLRWHGSQVGGAATHTRGVVNGLIDNGVAVDVIAPERPRDRTATSREVPPRRVMQLVRGLATPTTRVVERACGRHDRRLRLPALSVRLGRRPRARASARGAVRARVQRIGDLGAAPLGPGRPALARPLERLERRTPVTTRRSSSWFRRRSVTTWSRRGCADACSSTRTASTSTSSAPYRQGIRHRRGDGGLACGRADGRLHRHVRALARRRAAPGADRRRSRRAMGADRRRRAVLERAGRVRDEGAGGPASAERRGRARRALEVLACCDVCVSPHVPNPDGTPFFGSPTKLFEYMGLRQARSSPPTSTRSAR